MKKSIITIVESLRVLMRHPALSRLLLDGSVTVHRLARRNLAVIHIEVSAQRSDWPAFQRVLRVDYRRRMAEVRRTLGAMRLNAPPDCQAR